MRRILKLGSGGSLLVFAVAAASAGLLLHRNNVMLREKAGELRRQTESAARMTDENQRTQKYLALASMDEKEAALGLHQEVLRKRAEVRALQEHAHAVAAQISAAAAASASAVAANHDPEKGLARLENFQNVGRATPAAAMQTLIWAALAGDEKALEAAFSVTGAAREKALNLLARLPDADRVKHSTPESLAGLVWTDQLLSLDDMQILASVPTDSSHASVRLRCAEFPDTETLPMELTAGGWKVIENEQVFEALQRRLGLDRPQGAGR